MPNLLNIDKSWTLFLDRDGVINDEIQGEYVLSRAGFHFSEGVIEALKILRKKFGLLIVITNQRGVTKGLMTEDDLMDVHDYMKQTLQQQSISLDAIYYCTDSDAACFNRKPNPGMAFQAFKDFPQIVPAKTMMAGNKPSDMQFARAAGIHSVFIATTNPHEPFPHADVDLRFPDLLAFARALES